MTSDGFYCLTGHYPMHTKYLMLCSLALTAPLYAQEPPQNLTQEPNVFFDKDPLVKPDLLLNQPKITTPAAAPVETDNSLETRINAAIIGKDWARLEQLLKQYKQVSDKDQTLYDYGLGALYRHQGKQKKAIALYRQILARQPDLHYPRFDLAMMLFEDKQYQAAKTELELAKPNLTLPLQRLVDQILANMQKAQRWQPSLNLSYESTDNVNQASDLKEIRLGNATFVRSGDSLPQSAHGIDYTLGASRELNLSGNHYLYSDFEVDGVDYWDNHDYSEITARANLGYRYKDIHQSWGIIPLFEQNWLGGDRYNQNYGATLEYNRQLNQQWQLSGNVGHIQKRYQDSSIADRYDGHSNSIAGLVLYQPKPNWLVYGGADYMRDDLSDEAESSNRKGIRLGGVYSTEQLVWRGSMRYAKRDFWADNFWYDKKRHDDEYQFNASLSHKKLQWHGFKPKLNYSYQKIASNLDLYDRQNNNWFISFDKSF